MLIMEIGGKTGLKMDDGFYWINMKVDELTM